MDARLKATLWERTRWARYAFVAGLLTGILIGWFFYGVVSLVMRFALVAVLLIPIAILLVLWYRGRARTEPDNGPTMHTWGIGSDAGPGFGQPSQPTRDQLEEWLRELDEVEGGRRTTVTQARRSGTGHTGPLHDVDVEIIDDPDWRETRRRS